MFKYLWQLWSLTAQCYLILLTLWSMGFGRSLLITHDNSISWQDENLDLFFEVECHTLIGVANVFLECLLHDVNHEYAAPIISQQGEVRDEIQNGTSVHAGLSIRVVTCNTCHGWVCLMGPWCYRCTGLQLILFTEKVTSLFWVKIMATGVLKLTDSLDMKFLFLGAVVDVSYWFLLSNCT